MLGTVGWAGCEAGLLRRSEGAARHAVGAAWAHLTHVHTPLADMQAELMDITPARRLSARQRAALYGLQASCLYFLCGEDWGVGNPCHSRRVPKCDIASSISKRCRFNSLSAA